MQNAINSIPIPSSWIEQILDREQDDHRFEAFANDVVSVLEGKSVLGTSKSWDLGRDGKGVGARHGTFVITTLRTDSGKPKTDAEHLKAAAPKIRHVYYVAPRLVSETKLEEHAKEIRAVLGADVPIDSIGRVQLTELISSGKAAQAFRRHYRGELASITAALTSENDDPESKHLELALSTFGAQNTQELRDSLSSRLILGLLKSNALTLSEIAKGAADALGVSAFSESSARHYCDLLRSKSRISLEDDRYRITAIGEAFLSVGDTEVVATELSGRDAVRSAVEESLGSSIPEQQWDLMWSALQKALSHAFYLRGKQILDVVSTLLQGDTSRVPRDVLAVLVDNVIQNVVATYVAAPNRPKMLRAFQDAFLPGDPHGSFEWLAGVAGRFAATCTLGLPSEIAEALTATLKKIRCFIDTDVVISYLCNHEPSHAAAHALVRLNKKLGNQAMITDAVAEEAARHAMKSYTDYRVRVASVTGTLEWFEIAELESAFTREFESLRKEGKVKAQDWPNYIKRYAGEESKNYSGSRPPNTAKMRSLLSSESVAIRTPGDRSDRWERQRDNLAKAMYEEARRFQPDARPDIIEHKARIDAEMLIAVSRTIEDSQALGKGERYILVTSARRLRHLPSKVRQQLPDLPEILSLPEAATIATLIPEQPLSLRALHSLLFEGHFAQTVGRLEGLLLRIVRESSSAVIPGATRGVLAEEFGEAILRESKRTGEAQSEVRARIERDPVELAKIAAVAVDALALKRPIDREDVIRRIETLLGPKESKPESPISD